MIDRTTVKSVDVKVTQTEYHYEETEMESLMDDGCPNFRDDE